MGAIVTILDSFVFLLIHYFGIRKLEGFFIFLIFTMAMSFLLNMFISKPDPAEMLKGLMIPSIPPGALTAALGLIGAVIMPHNIYLYSSLVLTRKVDMRNKN